MIVGVAAPLEPGRRLRAQAEAAGALGDRHAVEPRHLDHDVGGGVGDLGGGTAHDPGQADRGVGRVADEQVVAGVRARSTSSRVTSVSPSAGPADPEAAAAEGAEVVGVRRAAELEHDVVRHVDQVVDRPHAEQRQPVGDQRVRGPGRSRPASTRAVNRPQRSGSAISTVTSVGRRAPSGRHRRRRERRTAARAGRPRRGPRRPPTWRRAGSG